LDAGGYCQPIFGTVIKTECPDGYSAAARIRLCREQSPSTRGLMGAK